MDIKKQSVKYISLLIKYVKNYQSEKLINKYIESYLKSCLLKISHKEKNSLNID